MITTLTAAQARRIALAAQGFGRPRPASVGTRQLNSAIDRLGLLQLDSVNVFERSHYLPLFARLGAYDRGQLDALTFARKGRYIEYWAHEAAIIPVESWPLFRWKMAALRARYSSIAGGWVESNPTMLDWLRAELAEKGPLAASQIEHDAGARKGPWWGWSEVKTGLEYLFMFGEVVTAGRTRFERTYALADAVLPSHILDAEVPKDEAIRRLMSVSAAAHGIGTLSDLADYFRLKQEPAKAAVRDLVDSGELIPVTVAGWNRPAWLHRDARMPRRIETTALLSPFDPVVWQRGRAERMFGFHYRIEIYTPPAKRVFGYYTLPLLVDDRLVGRVDLKSDRQNRVLRVQAAWTEAGAPPETAARLAPVLRETAAWQGLDGIEVMGRGDLAGAIAAELGVPVAEPGA
ncbi:winged helix-turn-helix domain-containing protein [Lacisediminihabitans profunda]|uniref:Winged helix-turn-helix domain-containing protein n=1 Tax=Lacisediminihabitans profunda TaxID=2594790 RepID=A0A5C8UU32_9MICO|nr:crosslink repair DNA glycosylase YcaQ family protein [Lacisediminihabitans profunda]TXN31146.1 winged helix-turn-helix domain-containing protein [Lacisediminihabitans profunda]